MEVTDFPPIRPRMKNIVKTCNVVCRWHNAAQSLLVGRAAVEWIIRLVLGSLARSGASF